MKQKLVFVIVSLMTIITMTACKSEKDSVETGEAVIAASEPAKEAKDTARMAEETDDEESDAVLAEGALLDTDQEAEPVIMTAPPFTYYVSDHAKEKENQSINLNMISSQANKITDDAEWFTAHNLSGNTYENLEEDLPDGIDSMQEELIITSAFYDDTYIYCTYGNDNTEGYFLNIYGAEKKQLLYSLDFSQYRYSPEYVREDYDYIQQKIQWAEIKGNILYISHSHNTYAKSSNYMNAYITAIDLTNGSIIWRTDALVSNAFNFQIIGDVILCGYGFTGEEDQLYQIDRNLGTVIEKIPLKSAPSYIIRKDDTLYVRTYNMDYEFKIDMEERE